MRRRFVTADVFTDRVFGGNPLGVVLDAEGLSPGQMQALAREFGYSETTFVLPPADPAHRAQVRIFTPTDELPFAGHPNVGTAVVLAEADAAEGRDVPDRYVFEEGAGLVPVRLLRAGGRATGAEFTAPRALEVGETLPPAQVAALAGLAEADVDTAPFAPTVASVGLPFVMAMVKTRAALRRARPDLAAFAQAVSAAGRLSLFLMTRDVDQQGIDVMSRMFAPMSNIMEDPATGSATAAATALLGSLDPALQVLRFAQGVDMGRPSFLDARMVRRDDGYSAHVGGGAVPVFRGTVELAGAAE